MTDSKSLLAEYARSGSDTAFRELVNRYVDLVYSTALRLVGGDTHRAQDVAQTVFLDLARKCRSLPADVPLVGWLHRDACFVAANTLRGERRRRLRERQAVEMNALQNQPEADFSHLAPVLDQAINELCEADRAAILLRFFEQQDFRSVGQALGSNEDAARMRVNRALEKLEALLRSHGVTASSLSLAVALGTHAVQAAPAGLAVTISTALTAASITTTTIATHATMHWLHIKSLAAIAAAAIAVGTGTHLIEQRHVNELRNQNENLIAQQEVIVRERDAALSAASQRNQEFEQFRKDKNELLRLRAEIGVLRRQTSALAELQKRSRSLPAGAVVAPSLNTAAETEARHACINNLRRIDGAIQQCGIENRMKPEDTVTTEQIRPYLPDKQLPRCPSGGTYTFGILTNVPTCSIPGHAILPATPATSESSSGSPPTP